ncbi:MAG: hypothetical protein EON48_05150 [Acetobacteraceae bacterium]|nr:MAG: hypothetical protein EON48_05150 [Acetobacteraceae bacterium]
MKVIHRSETMLVLEDRPWLLGICLIGMALAFVFGGMAMIGEGRALGGAFFAAFGGGVPILIAALMVRRVRLTLDRSTGLLTRTMRSVRGFSAESHALDRLTKASVSVNYDSDGNTYRTELHLADPDETVPFTSYYTSGRRPEAMAEAVNHWLTTPR